MAETNSKPVHTLVLDTGAIIKNEPSVSTLISKAESLFTVPAIISEIKDAATRSRVETMLMPFLTVRQPSPAAMKFVTDFARRTGDLPVLSKPDLQIIALTYELELERSGGDWRLRRTPGQKELNGPFPPKEGEANVEEGKKDGEGKAEGQSQVEAATVEADAPKESSTEAAPPAQEAQQEVSGDVEPTEVTEAAKTADAEQNQDSQKDVTQALAQTSLEDRNSVPDQTDAAPKEDSTTTSASAPAPAQDDDESDGEGWITPSNLKQKQAQDSQSAVADAYPQKTLQVAVLTTDFAMQNTILQINLNLLSSSMMRIRHVRSVALRCQACFLVSKEMNKQFCPRCGKPTLSRVSCSTTANGEFKIHLKKNFQYNSRGDRYSIPKAVSGAANGKIKGGGKGGWGNGLILAEDQKEYERAVKTEQRQKERNLMDEDYLPGILTGDRSKTGGRIKVGAGRNVNSKKR